MEIIFDSNNKFTIEGHSLMHKAKADLNAYNNDIFP